MLQPTVAQQFDDTLQMLIRSEFSGLENFYKKNKHLKIFFYAYFLKAHECAILEDQLDPIKYEISDLQQQFADAFADKNRKRGNKRMQAIMKQIEGLEAQCFDIQAKMISPIEEIKKEVKHQIDVIVSQLAIKGVDL